MMVNVLTTTLPSCFSGSPRSRLLGREHCHHRGHLLQLVRADEPAPALCKGEKAAVEEGRDPAGYPSH